ncbi:hypothetical protein Vafri_17679 [Volvox africanus]|uniref:VWFA domain-containing protein n=1 Tax=Volvox africanus TaxID=51714 RepID=A0A8J4BMH8_9CHLO|nr:hypothetical protein Vafri_17679 [Volvox africanus]
MLIYCLDNSDAACRSEDYPCGNRLAWQLAVVRTVSRSLLAPQQGQQLGSTSNPSPQLAVVSSAGRPALSIAPTSDAAALLGLDVSCLDGERCQFLGALRLALLAVKRSSTGRVLAFLASEADLPPEQCRQLSRCFADARIPLDVLVLSPNDELPPELTASLQLLTAISVYDQSPGTAETGPGPTSQRPGLRRGAPGSGPRAASGGQVREQQSEPTASGDGSMASAPTGVAATLATPEARAQVARAEEGVAASMAVVPPCGQRLLLFPPPEPSLALWQQMEPLLEMLQLEVHAGNHQPGGDGETSTVGVEDERGVPSQLRTGNGAGRPPLPRPPRYRAGSATGSTTTAVSPSVGQRAPGLTPSGPLTSRSGARGATAGTCRYESLDSLQHLSLDGFLRSWLPSYANFSRVLQLPVAAAQQQQQQQQGGGTSEGAGGGGATGIRSTADADGASAGLGPGRLCYISVYRLQLPRWHKLCEVHAGCMYEADLPEGADPPATGSATAPEGAVAGAAVALTMVSPGQSESQATAVLQPSAQSQPAVVVPRAPCPVQIHFSTKCSSAAAAAVAAAGGDSTAAGSRCHWVYPDLRRGSLSLVASVEDPGVVKLLWNERQRANAQQQPQYGSIFATAEESNDSVEPTTAELELTLSPTRSQFRVVTHAKGGAVLEVLYPRSCVHRPRPSSSNAGSHSAPQHSAQRVHGDTAQRGPSPMSAQTSTQPSHHHSHHHHSQQQQQQQHDRYFFWLQQDWQPEVAAAEAAAPMPAGQAPATKASSAESDCVGEAGSGDSGGTGRSGPLPDRGCRALTEHLQALLECPPEFDPQKHGCRVRCSSTPLQLGPLPFALVEEIMRASGRQLHPDGTLAVATTARSAFSAAAAAASSSNHPTTASGAVATARMQTLHQQLHQAGSRRTASGTQGKGGELCRGPAGVVVLQRDRAAAGQGPGADGQSRSSAGLAGAGAATNSAAPAPKRPATNTPLAAAPGPAAAGDADVPGDTGRARSTLLSDMRGSVPGFSRTTYSRASALHGDCGPTGSVVSALARPEKLTRLEAATVLSSHPLEDAEWGSDCDSRAEGPPSDVSSGAATPRSQDCSFSGKDLSGPETGMAAVAGADDADSGALDIGEGSLTANSADSASAAGELSPAGAPHLPSGCTRGGLAAAAAVAAAAAAVGSSGPSLVAAVEPEAGGSCTEDSSLMFELD